MATRQSHDHWTHSWWIENINSQQEQYPINTFLKINPLSQISPVKQVAYLAAVLGLGYDVLLHVCSYTSLDQNAYSWVAVTILHLTFEQGHNINLTRHNPIYDTRHHTHMHRGLSRLLALLSLADHSLHYTVIINRAALGIHQTGWPPH